MREVAHLWLSGVVHDYPCVKGKCTEGDKRLRNCDGKEKRTRWVEKIIAYDKPEELMWYQCPMRALPDYAWRLISLFTEYTKNIYFFPGKTLEEQPHWYYQAMKTIAYVKYKYEEKQMKDRERKMQHGKSFKGVR